MSRFYNEGSPWFRRLQKEVLALSPFLRFVRIKFGFFRIYWRDAYIGECSKDMTAKGYDFETLDPRLENKSYYEEYEDNAELIQKVKNFKEGYYDSIDKIKTRVFMFKNNDEFYQEAKNAYKQMYIR